MSDTLPQQEPPITTPNKVFISYTHDDAVLVAKLLDDLEKNNIQAWIDTKGLEPGTPDWEEAIRTAISTASCVLLIASPESR
ncbi:MAG: toll/interleukin-1 receptor domain-containing protein, partial [Chloroflexi bacterium]|nr:toll/interleukin-1 receptor domain-containing protein [Chloroflexota bacterium]